MTTSAKEKDIQADPYSWDPDLVRAVNEVFFDVIKPKKIRTMQQFAEEEIVLPDGPHEGKKFRCYRMPFLAALLAIFISGLFNRFFGQAARQTAKTLAYFQIPLLYHLFEIEEDVIVGVPNIKLAQEIWERRIEPMIKASSFSHLLPIKGPGSRGGTNVKQLTFGNGCRLIFMSEGYSHTARVVIFTEIYRMQDIAGKSGEGTPFRQIEKCTESFAGAKMIYGECIVTDEHTGVWDDIASGTDSQVYFRCPLCGEYILPKRSGFAGWQTAKSDKKAAAQCYYSCPKCQGEWKTEAQHIEATQDYKIIHKGQKVSAAGRVSGDIPDTFTFGLTWNRMHTTVRPIPKEDQEGTVMDLSVMATIAIEEYNASRSSDPADEVAVSQYIWAEPPERNLAGESALTIDLLTRKIGRHPFAEIPPGADKLVVSIDIGEKTHWWMAMAFREMTGEGYIIDYGRLPVVQGSMTKGAAMLNALRIFRENELRRGWKQENIMKTPDLVLVDSGYGDYVNEIYEFVHESGQGIYFATKGTGTAPNMPEWKNPDKKKKGRKIGDNWMMDIQRDRKTWLLLMHSDFYKTKMHDRLMVAQNAPGSIYLFDKPPEYHLELMRHLLAESRKTIILEGRKGGLITVWSNPGGRPNHLGDCLYQCLVGGNMLGIIVPFAGDDLPRVSQNQTPQRSAGESGQRKPARRRKTIRTKW